MTGSFLQQWHTLSSYDDRKDFLKKAVSDGVPAEDLSQILPKYDRILQSLTPSPTVLLNHIQAARKQRELKLSDCMRPRPGFTYQKSWNRLVITDQRDESAELSKLLADPDAFIEKGHVIKSGAATTVATVSSGAKKYFIKRYNTRNTLYSVTRSLIPSRAAVTWHAAQLLESIGVPTARPLAILEKRWGPIKLESYIIHEHINSIHGMKYFAEGASPKPEWDQAASEIIDILFTLKRSLIIHGDLKAHNFIINNDSPLLIDLDSIKSFHYKFIFNKKYAKDLSRFKRNWDNEPQAQSLFKNSIQSLSV
jgi:tRNA A-37 threonylcarbamoyl transferase component Bud32